MTCRCAKAINRTVDFDVGRLLDAAGVLSNDVWLL
jgi:hypothetical protein